MVYRILFPVLFVLVGGTGNSTMTEYDYDQSYEDDLSDVIGIHDNCTDVRHLKLGIYAVYHKSMVENRQKRNSSQNITEYLHKLVRLAELSHFKWIPCTNISLTLTGVSALDESWAVVNYTKRKSVDLDPTLANFRNYSLHHREEFRDPDVTVLFTEEFMWNSSRECRDIHLAINNSYRYDPPPEFRAYCTIFAGNTYYKGICGPNSVALVYDWMGEFRGAHGLAKQIIRLLGASFDVLRKDECYTDYRYLSTAASDSSWCRDLSLCAKAEIMNFIDCERNSTSACWEDDPIPLGIATSELQAIELKCNKRCSCMSF